MDKILAALFLFFFVGIPLLALWVWVMAVIWNGVAVPNFGAPPLSFWEMFGLLFLTRALLGRTSVSLRDKESK